MPQSAASAAPVAPSLFARLLARRHGGLLVFVLVFVAVAQLTRLALLYQARADVSWNLAGLLGAAAIGTAFDIAAALLWAAPLWLLLTALPARAFASRLGRGLAHAFLLSVLYALLFGAVAEWFFWDEFGARFNFIAVDYLVYTKEVVGNIRESYPMPWILAGLGAATLAGYALVLRTGLVGRWLAAPTEPWSLRWRRSLPWLAAIVLAAVAVEERLIPAFADNYQRSSPRTASGPSSPPSAPTSSPTPTSTPPARSTPLRHPPPRSRCRRLRAPRAPAARHAPPRPQRRSRAPPNIIQITVESLSAEFLGSFNPDSKLTPNLDALAPQSSSSPGSTPPAPAPTAAWRRSPSRSRPPRRRSLVKRPHNEGLFTLAASCAPAATTPPSSTAATATSTT
jgi:hypothetical protein